MKFTKKQKLIVGLLGAGLYTIPMLAINGAIDIFLKSENGEIDGESLVAGYEGWIEIESFQVGGAREISLPSTIREVSRPSLSDVTLTKAMDQTSPALFHKLTVGTTFPELKLFIPSTDRIIRIYLRDVVVSSVSWNAGSGNDKVSETISLNYTAFKVEHYSIATKGVTGTASYDLLTATEGY